MMGTFERDSTQGGMQLGISPLRRSRAAEQNRAADQNTAPQNSQTLKRGQTLSTRGALAKGLFVTVPIVLVSTMALSLNLTAPIHTDAKRTDKPKPSPAELGKSIREAFAAASRATANPATTVASKGASIVASSTPSVYTVAAGDSISSIAGKFGLATASVLALNGLGWTSVIFPGQKLSLGKGGVTPIASKKVVTVATTRYTIVTGDTISHIAAKFGLTVHTLLSANGLSASSIIYPGQTIAVPSTNSTTALSEQVLSESPAPAAAANRPSSGTSYVIKSGDSIAGVAAKFGVTTQAILTANGLGWSSIIYSGKTLTIPALAVVQTAYTTPVAPSTALTAEMRANALTIIRVGKSLGVPTFGLVTALATAAQESGLRNLTYGDRDSIGLFQQRPSAGWGSRSQILDPTYSAKLFFGGPRNPNAVNTRGLLDIAGWQQMKLTQAAQAVQLSAFPNAYAKWETAARTWLNQLS